MRPKSLPLSDERERIAAPAKLPVFWNLSGKRVVVAGGSDGAAWKAELLQAAVQALSSIAKPAISARR